MQNSRIGLVLFCLGLLVSVSAIPARAQESAGALQEKTESYYEIQVVKGNLALKEGKFEDALAIAEDVLADKPNNAEALAIKSRALFSLGRGSEAVEGFQKLEGQDLEDQRWRIGYGITLREQGDEAGAKAQFEKAAKAHPESGAANYNLGVSLFNEKNYKGAAPYFDKAIEAKFSLAASNYYRGRCAQERGNTGKARSSYQAAQSAGPSGRLASDLDKAVASLDAGAPAAGEEEGGLRVSGRLGYSYDTNVTLNPSDAANSTVAGSPFTGGSQKDGRIETVLDLSYSASKGDTTLGGGYNFLGFWQLGHGKATTDFTLLSHDLGIFAQHDYGENAVSLSVDGVLSTLGRIPGADDFKST
ncbi:MAG: tetratricopeptide repeat protein, partial [Chrysiogenetes bacterium]|nr:tetratricopeptide repeat protein [Chrysiogenetes bacterium]